MAVEDVLSIPADMPLSANMGANDAGVEPTGFFFNIASPPVFTTPTSSTPVMLSGGFFLSTAGVLTFTPALSNGGLKAGTVVTYTYYITTPSGAKSNNATVTITIKPGEGHAYIDGRPPVQGVRMYAMGAPTSRFGTCTTGIIK